MIKNMIKYLYLPFRYPKLLSDHSEGLIFAMVGRQFRTPLRIEVVSIDLLSCFFFFFVTILYHLLDCKMVSDRF